MSIQTRKVENVDLVDLVAAEIARSREERRPTSRQMLAEYVQDKTGMILTDAVSFVETYCEEREPGIPMFLQEEVAIPYLKFIAIINVFLGLGFIAYGVNLLRSGKPAHIQFSIGTVWAGLGVFAYVQSLEKFAERRKKRLQSR